MQRTREDVEQMARQTATRLLDLLAARQFVPQFVENYVRANKRTGLKSSPLRYRELQMTLTRESLLALVARVRAELPAHITGRKSGLLRGADAEAMEAFNAALFARLVLALKWSAAEAEEFQHDSALYAHMAARLQSSRRERFKSAGAFAEGPFVDRCALLLDPSLLDKAREAAGKLLAELERAADQVLAAAFTQEKGKADSSSRKKHRDSE